MNFLAHPEVRTGIAGRSVESALDNKDSGWSFFYSMGVKIADFYVSLQIPPQGGDIMMKVFAFTSEEIW